MNQQLFCCEQQERGGGAWLDLSSYIEISSGVHPLTCSWTLSWFLFEQVSSFVLGKLQYVNIHHLPQTLKQTTAGLDFSSW